MDYKIQDTTLRAIADAINAKTGETGQMTPLEMPEKIASISSGGGITDLQDTTWVLKDTPTRLSDELSRVNITVSFGIEGTMYFEEFRETVAFYSKYPEALFCCDERKGETDINQLIISTNSDLDYQGYTMITYNVSQNLWCIDATSTAGRVVYPTNITFRVVGHCTDPSLIAWLKLNATQIL